jgi:predicted nuclease with TOPRIM domain
VEVNLKDTNERVENLEMENYNLRERFQEQEKLLDECRALVQELLTLFDEPSSSDQAIGKPEET